MSTFNQAVIVGNLGGDPELRTTTGGTLVATFSMATTEKWTADNGRKQEQTDWHRIVVWGKLAPLCAKYLHKGDKALVRGKIRYRTWQDKDGQTRYSTEVIADSVAFLSARRDKAVAPADAGEEFEDFPSALEDEPAPF